MPATRGQALKQLKSVKFVTRDGEVRQFQTSSKAALRKRPSTRTNEQLRAHMVGKLGLPEAFFKQALRVKQGKGVKSK